MTVTLVEIDSTLSGAFMFKTFKGENSLKNAETFCTLLQKRCKTLKAFVIKTIE